MEKLKAAELIIAAVSAVVMIAKAVVRLITYISRMKRRRPAIGMA
jgi:hypothetical protein